MAGGVCLGRGADEVVQEEDYREQEAGDEGGVRDSVPTEFGNENVVAEVVQIFGDSVGGESGVVDDFRHLGEVVVTILATDVGGCRGRRSWGLMRRMRMGNRHRVAAMTSSP